MKSAILSFVFLMAISGMSHLYAQQLYTWTDENGVTHITDQPPPPRVKVEDVLKYKEKTPQEQAAIDRKMEQLRQSIEQQDKIDAARRAEVAAREAEKQAEEAVENAQEQTQENQEYIRKLSNRKWKRRKFRKRIERIKTETEATQAEAQTEARQAEEAAKKARAAAAEAQKTQ